MNIENLIKESPNVILQVSAEDLQNVIQNVVNNLIERHDKKDKKADKFISTKQFCEVVDITRSTAWRWTKCGCLVLVRVGGKVRYKVSDVERVLKRSIDIVNYIKKIFKIICFVAHIFFTIFALISKMRKVVF